MPHPFQQQTTPHPVKHRLTISGTLAMVLGTTTIAVSALGFQVISGRVLGAEAFTPVGVAWTVVFFSFTVLMIPAEQVITRRLTLTGGNWDGSRGAIAPIAAALATATLGSAVFVAATLNRFFDSNPWFILAIAVAVTSRGVLAIGRGFLAGRRRFVAYGAATGMEGILLLPAAAAVGIVAPSALAFAWIMAITPLSVLLTRPFTQGSTTKVLGDGHAQSASFLGALVVATGASQIVLAGGPIVVGLVGGSAGAVSVYFITFTLFRGPVTSSYNLIARILPDFTALAARGQARQLSIWAGRLGIAGLLTTAAFGVAGYLLGPAVVRLLYGAEFAPGAKVAALGAAAVGSALVGLFVSQVFVARGEANRMAAIWAIALLCAGLALTATDGEPLLRVATAFLVGEFTATSLLAGVAVADHISDPA